MKKNITQINLLKDIIGKLSGKNSVELADILYNKKNVNEFFIAKKLNLTIHQIRRVLYRLSDFGLVSFIKKKDKRKGWYTYFWTLNIKRSLKVLHKELDEEISQLEHQLKSRQMKRFYICKTCAKEVNEETALLHDFVCKECGSVYSLSENKKTINELTSKLNSLKKERQEAEKEIKIIEEKEEKSKKRKERREIAAKKAERKKRAAARKRAKAKEKKAAAKKKPKKKAAGKKSKSKKTKRADKKKLKKKKISKKKTKKPKKKLKKK